MLTKDYCFMCGEEVDPEKWREHLILAHRLITKNPPQVDGKWLEEENLEFYN